MPTEYFQDYITVGAFAAAGVGLVALTLGIAALLRPSNPNPGKLTTYECGVDPVGGGWSQTYVRYYIFGLLFVIFDVEAVFVFPWAVLLDRLGPDSLVSPLWALAVMVLFLATLFEGLLYAIRKGLLRWE